MFSVAVIADVKNDQVENKRLHLVIQDKIMSNSCE